MNSGTAESAFVSQLELRQPPPPGKHGVSVSWYQDKTLQVYFVYIKLSSCHFKCGCSVQSYFQYYYREYTKLILISIVASLALPGPTWPCWGYIWFEQLNWEIKQQCTTVEYKAVPRQKVKTSPSSPQQNPTNPTPFNQEVSRVPKGDIHPLKNQDTKIASFAGLLVGGRGGEK